MTQTGARPKGGATLRVKKSDKTLFMRAASLQNKEWTDFVLEAATAAAQDALLDKHAFVLDDKQYFDFVKALDNTPVENPSLRALLSRKPLWQPS